MGLGCGSGCGSQVEWWCEARGDESMDDAQRAKDGARQGRSVAAKRRKSATNVFAVKRAGR